jgi:predicted ATPase/DNA-binding SARP family transcriptional activator
VCLLGPPRIELDGTVVELKRRKVLALLAYLAVTAHPHNRDVLTELLYPGRGRTRAMANFRQTLSCLRTALGDPWIHADFGNVSLPTSNSLWVDVHEFQAFVKPARSISGSGGTEEEQAKEERRLMEAARLYRGEFLAGFYLKDSPAFEEWQFLQKETLQQDYAAVLDRLVEIHTTHGQLDRAIEEARRRVALDPVDERAHRRLMRIYERAGRRSAAMRQYELCRMILNSELEEEPARETQVLYERIKHRSIGSKSTSVRTPDELPNNFPTQTTSLIGRFRETSELIELLMRTQPRLITLTGPGGVGKTRLALEGAAGAAKAFHHGVFFIDLLNVRLPEQLPSSIAGALGLRQSMGQDKPLSELLVDFLSGKTALILLDNFEHILPAAPYVTRLLESSPNSKILVTSRQPLHLPAERLFAVPPLALASDGNGHAAAAPSDAVRLLAERGAAARPGFRITAENSAALEEICRHLDGIPLAIELAASRLKVLSARELAKRLSGRIKLLGCDSAALPYRQQTLSRTIDWSYELLDKGEQKLLLSLSVFVGGCTPEAVEHVCEEPDGATEADVLDTLASLVDKNLVKREEREDATRFLLLETIAEYARARFEGDCRAAAIRQRHAFYYLGMAKLAEPELYRLDQMEWLDRLEQEIGNLAAAMDWFLDGRKGREALELAISLHWFCYRLGHFSEGQQWLQQSLDQESGPELNKLEAHATRALAWMVFTQGDWLRSRELYTRSLCLFRDLGEPAGEALALSGSGVAERWLGNHEEGTKHVEEAVQVARRAGHPLGIAYALIFAYATTGGKFEGPPPREELEQALELARRWGDRWAIAHALNGLGDLFRELRRHSEARPHYREALKSFRALKDRWMTAWTLEGLGAVSESLGEQVKAESYFQESLALFYRLGDRGNCVYMLGRLGVAALARGARDRAARLLGAYKGLRESLVFSSAPVKEIFDREVSEAFTACQVERAEQWICGRAMVLEQAIEYALQGLKATV